MNRFEKKIDELTKEDLLFQLKNVKNYAKQLNEENKLLREEKTKIHNRATELWRYDFYIDPFVSRRIANQLHVNFEHAEFHSKLEDTLTILEALRKIRRTKPSEEELYETLKKLQQSHTVLTDTLQKEKNRHKETQKQLISIQIQYKEKEEEVDRLKAQISMLEKQLEEQKEKSTWKPITSHHEYQAVSLESVDGNLVPVNKTVEIDEKAKAIVEKMKKEVFRKKTKQKEHKYSKEEKQPVVLKEQSKATELIEAHEENMEKKVENLVIYSLLEKYNPTPPSNHLYDCDIEYEGEKAAVVMVKEGLNDTAVFEQITKETNKIFFVGDNEHFFRNKVGNKFLNWMLSNGKIDKIELSFTLQEKLAKTKKLEKLRKI